MPKIFSSLEGAKQKSFKRGINVLPGSLKGIGLNLTVSGILDCFLLLWWSHLNFKESLFVLCWTHSH